MTAQIIHTDPVNGGSVDRDLSNQITAKGIVNDNDRVSVWAQVRNVKNFTLALAREGTEFVDPAVDPNWKFTFFIPDVGNYSLTVFAQNQNGFVSSTISIVVRTFDEKAKKGKVKES
jgi:hypothetical protein